MAKTTTILVASVQLIGGKPGGRVTLDSDEELTAEMQKKLGLSKADVADLLARGQLRETTVRVAGSVGDSPAHTALEKRAEVAEAARDEAIKRAAAAEARVVELEQAAAEAAENPPAAA